MSKKITEIKPIFNKDRNRFRVDLRSVEPKVKGVNQVTFHKTEDEGKEFLKKIIEKLPSHFHNKFGYTLRQLFKDFKKEEIPGVPSEIPGQFHYKLSDYNKIKRLEFMLDMVVFNKKKFGSWLVRDIDAGIVQKEIINKLGLTRKKKTVGEYNANLSQMFDYAMQESVVKFNPIRIGNGRASKNLIKIKGLENKRKVSATKILPSVINKLIDTSPTIYWKSAVAFAAYTGARLGEQRALCWGDIDFENETVRILSTVYNPKKIINGVWKTETKIKHRTKAGELRDEDPGERIIDLDPDLLVFLKEHKLNTKFKSPTDLIWGSRKNKIKRENGFREHLLFVCKKAGIDYINWHLLRHFFASLLIAAKMDAKDVCEVMGHADELTTKRIYDHAFRSAAGRVNLKRMMLQKGTYSTPMAVNETQYNFIEK